MQALFGWLRCVHRREVGPGLNPQRRTFALGMVLWLATTAVGRADGTVPQLERGQVLARWVEPATEDVTPAQGARIKARCAEQLHGALVRFTAEPVLAFDLREPVGGLMVRYVAPSLEAGDSGVFVAVTGPMGAAGEKGHAPVVCMRVGKRPSPLVRASVVGKYTIRMGFPPGTRAAPGALVVRRRRTREDATVVTRPVPHDLAAGKRTLAEFMPLVDAVAHREARADVVLKAPRALLLYVTRDLSSDNARWERMADMEPVTRRAIGLPDFPRAGEPVVLVGHVLGKPHIWTMDGLEYAVDPDVLTVAAPQQPTLVAAPRMVMLDLASELDNPWLTTEERLLLEAHLARARNVDACWLRQMKRLGAFVPEGTGLQQVTRVNGRVISVENYQDATGAKAEKRCRVQQFWTDEEAVMLTLEKGLQLRTAERSVQMRQRLEHPW